MLVLFHGFQEILSYYFVIIVASFSFGASLDILCSSFKHTSQYLLFADIQIGRIYTIQIDARIYHIMAYIILGLLFKSSARVLTDIIHVGEL